MNFDLNNDQIQLRDSLRRMLANTCSFDKRRAAARSDAGYSLQAWQHMAELGLTALAIAEDDGGLSANAIDRMLVMEEFGAHFGLEPLYCGWLAATVLGHAADAAQRARVLPAIAAGQAIATLAHEEPQARHAPLWVACQAQQRDGHWHLRGEKQHVLLGQHARFAVVSARVAGAPDDPAGLGWFLLDLGQEPGQLPAGLSARHYRLLDDTRASQWHFDQVRVEPLAAMEAASVLGHLRAQALACLCAQAVGAMRTAFELTTAYLHARKQFGKALAEHQSLRHRVAEMHVALEAGRSAAVLAALCVDDPAQCEEPGDLSRAKWLVARHGRFVCEQAIQLHGGIGMTEEYAVGHALRRLTVIDNSFGDAHSHLETLASAV